MIAVGGEAPGVSNYDQPPDTWPQGLAILDLTELQWIESYDSDAAPYQTPQLVKDGISVNGTYPQTWNDPVVVEWLLGKSLADITNVANPTSNSTSSTAGSSDLEAKDLSTGAIVGIAVDSVIGLALLGICVWCFRRARLRQRQRKNIIAQDDPNCYEKSELDSAASPRLNEKPELACIISENQHSFRREYNDSHELGPPVQYEMEGSIAGQELSSDTAVNTSDSSRNALVGSVVDSNSKNKGVDTRSEMHELAGTT
ncbi:hypothetical protein LTR70_010781 [Exophiala xenobiotica]|nr:hypothetical protein LTR70_010781 [Exophiala xenobiotica]